MLKKKPTTVAALLLSVVAASACLANYTVMCGTKTLTAGGVFGPYSCTVASSQSWQGLQNASTGGSRTSSSMITCQWACTGISPSGWTSSLSDSSDVYYTSVTDSSCSGGGGSGGSGS